MSGHLVVPNSFESISTVTLGSSASGITFSSIPNTYSHLQFRISGYMSGGNWAVIQFNGDTSGNTRHILYGNGSAVTAGSATTDGLTYLSSSSGGAGITDVLDYTNTNKYKTVRTLGGWDLNGSGYIVLGSNLWQNTSAITSVTFAGNSSWAAGSTIALYGVK